jgi:2-polyprenyl-6-hydroxyphenyl methylase/3-demethylubiquinone-9 3-methyltransferase
MGSQSTRWRWIKRTYNRIPEALRIPFVLMVIAPGEAKSMVKSVLLRRSQEYFLSWTQYSTGRGMNRWRDFVDWVGGYPYEVAKPEEIFDFYRGKGFSLTKLKCGGVGLGCNEFVLRKE